jgi:hypothetical protein
MTSMYNECKSCNRRTVHSYLHSADGCVSNVQTTFLFADEESFIRDGYWSYAISKFSGRRTHTLRILQDISISSQLMCGLALWAIISFVSHFARSSHRCYPIEAPTKGTAATRVWRPISYTCPCMVYAWRSPCVLVTRIREWKVFGFLQMWIGRRGPLACRQVHLT